MKLFRTLAFLSAFAFPTVPTPADPPVDSYAQHPVNWPDAVVDARRVHPPGFGAPFSAPSLERARRFTFSPPATPDGPFANPAVNMPGPGQLPVRPHFFHPRRHDRWGDRHVSNSRFQHHHFDRSTRGRGMDEPMFGAHDRFGMRPGHRFEAKRGDRFGPMLGDGRHHGHPFHHRPHARPRSPAASPTTIAV